MERTPVKPKSIKPSKTWLTCYWKSQPLPRRRETEMNNAQQDDDRDTFQEEIKVNEPIDDRDQTHGEVVDDAVMEAESGAEPLTPRCGISWGDSGMVISCPSLEDAATAVEWMRKTLKIEIKPQLDEPDPPAVEPNDDEDKDD